MWTKEAEKKASMPDGICSVCRSPLEREFYVDAVVHLCMGAGAAAPVRAPEKKKKRDYTRVIPYTIDELCSLYPNFNLHTFLQALDAPDAPSPYSYESVVRHKVDPIRFVAMFFEKAVDDRNDEIVPNGVYRAAHTKFLIQTPPAEPRTLRHAWRERTGELCERLVAMREALQDKRRRYHAQLESASRGL